MHDGGGVLLIGPGSAPPSTGGGAVGESFLLGLIRLLGRPRRGAFERAPCRAGLSTRTNLLPQVSIESLCALHLEASLAHLRVPARHRINVRTTNLLERSFVEERRRTNVIPRLLDERSAMKLVFATLIRVSDRWQRVPLSDLERQQLRLLRRELGVDPDPTEKKETPKRKRSAA